MIFTTPNIKYKDTYIKAVEELKQEGIERYQKTDIEDLKNNFEKYLKDWGNQEKGIGLAPGRVPDTKYWLIENGKFVGVAYFRHFLNDHLLKIGGHIGYFVAPEERKKGYGTKLLEYSLVKAKEKGLDKVLVTCDDTNIGSRKIIEKCGGKLENIVPGEKPSDPPKCRFWISLK